jgi:hypothetical protein
VSKIFHDVECVDCGTIQKHVAMEPLQYPSCPLCGGKGKANYEHGQPPGTDLYMTPKWNEGTGRMETSHREAEKYMRKKHGYEGGSGDKVGGARHEHRIVGTGYSYAGQGSRLSTAERATR